VYGLKELAFRLSIQAGQARKQDMSNSKKILVAVDGSSQSLNYLGSVSYKIVQAVGNTPVWVVGDGIKSRKMLLAVDNSDNSSKAVDFAGTFAAANGAEVTLFNAVQEFSLELLDISTPRGAEIEASILEELERDVQLMFDAYKIRLE
jgi:hypothetical protein